MGKYIFMPENCNHSSRQYEQEGLRLNKISCNDCGEVLWQRNQQNAHLTPEIQSTPQAESNAETLEPSDGDTPPAQAQVS